MDQEGQLFDAYAQRDPSPVLNWLLIALGFIASIIVALGFCPVPRSQTLSIAAALLLAATYVVGTVGVGVAVLAATGMIVARRGPEVSVWRVAPLFCAVAAWMTPTVAFYMRDSLWAASAAFVLSALGSRLIYRHHLTTGARAAATDDADFQISESSRARRISLTLAALLLNLGVLFIVVSVAHPAAILIGSSIGVISFVYESSAALNQLPLQSRFSKAVRFSITAGAAIILVGASLTPYLATYGGGTNPAHTGSTTQHSTASRSGRIGKPRARFLQSIASLFRRSEAGDTQSDTPSRPSDAASSARPYPTLQAIFGEGDSESGKESTSLKKILKTTRATLLVAGDPEPGVILRPNIRDRSRYGLRPRCDGYSTGSQASGRPTRFRFRSTARTGYSEPQTRRFLPTSWMCVATRLRSHSRRQTTAQSRWRRARILVRSSTCRVAAQSSLSSQTAIAGQEPFRSN